MVVWRWGDGGDLLQFQLLKQGKLISKIIVNDGDIDTTYNSFKPGLVLQ